LISYRTVSSQEVPNDSSLLQINVESNQTKVKPKSESDEVGCLSAEYPKRKKMVYAGVLNIKAIDIPKPEYPAEAKSEKITGEVKAIVVVDETGKVVWARVNNRHSLLQAAVKKVVCKPRFKPATISANPISVSGLITYRFLPPK
jgi:TonB family protein